MSENGKLTNGILREAYAALLAAGENGKLPLVSVGSRLALNRNHLRPLIVAIEESLTQLQQACGVRQVEGGAFIVVNEAVRTFRERAEKTDAFQRQAKELLNGEVTWMPAATIELRKFSEDCGVTGNTLAALMEAGIVVGEPHPETTPDKK